MVETVTGIDRRSVRRLAFSEGFGTSMSFHLDGVTKSIAVENIDLGEMGIGVLSHECVPMGTRVTILMPNSGKPHASMGVIKWATSVPTGKFKMGIQLETNLNLGSPSLRDSVVEARRGEKDRRSPYPWFNRRNTNRRSKEFILDHFVFLSDTNLVGNTYFAKHFEWQGHVREAFLFSRVNFQEFVKLGIKLITKEASCEYMSESTLGDPILLTLKVGKVTHARLELLFTFYHKLTNRIVSRGRQIIVFGGLSGKPVGIPKMILEGIKPYR